MGLQQHTTCYDSHSFNEVASSSHTNCLRGRAAPLIKDTSGTDDVCAAGVRCSRWVAALR